jgi:hypothetical protein
VAVARETDGWVVRAAEQQKNDKEEIAMSDIEGDRQQHGGPAPPPKQKRAGWKRGSGSIRKRLSGKFYIRYWTWDPQQRRWRRVEETLDVKTASEARAILNERLGDVSKGLTPVAVSKVRLSELHEDLVADYRNKDQRLENLERPWKHIEAFFGPDCLAKTINDSRMQRYIDSRRARTEQHPRRY